MHWHAPTFSSTTMAGISHSPPRCGHSGRITAGRICSWMALGARSGGWRTSRTLLCPASHGAPRRGLSAAQETVRSAVSSRRGTILHSPPPAGSQAYEPRAGSNLVSLAAHLSAAESLGLAEELATRTGNRAFVDSAFSHWQMMEADPLIEGPLRDEIVATLRVRKGFWTTGSWTKTRRRPPRRTPLHGLPRRLLSLLPNRRRSMRRRRLPRRERRVEEGGGGEMCSLSLGRSGGWYLSGLDRFPCMSS
ncbi:hypothetical protein T484DRAFT_2493770 [Baffinella frigidus]|nr:hypothetical protein T484DRAFT_2493770 [Cryptophyta sp. CCMP2293]